jgi:hypothetical protein
MKFVDTLKDITRKRDDDLKDSPIDDDIAAEIRRDPQYAKVLNKLQELYVEREQLTNRLRKIELDIDTCLVLIDINQERKELSKNEEG